MASRYSREESLLFASTTSGEGAPGTEQGQAHCWIGPAWAFDPLDRHEVYT